jgi:hypothetical protein
MMHDEVLYRSEYNAGAGVSTAAGTGRAQEPDFRALVGPEGWNCLDADIRRRFAPGHAATAIRYRGHMDVERSKIGLVFATLALLIGAPLPVRRAEDAPTIVRVWDDHHGGVVWERRLHLRPHRAPACIRSTKRLGPTGALLECVDGGLGMVLAVFEEDRSLVFESRRYFFALGGVRIPIPAFLTPGRCRVTHAAVAPTRFRFTMEMVHPLWGRTFHQTGLFDDPEATA